MYAIGTVLTFLTLALIFSDREFMAFIGPILGLAVVAGVGALLLTAFTNAYPGTATWVGRFLGIAIGGGALYLVVKGWPETKAKWRRTSLVKKCLVVASLSPLPMIGIAVFVYHAIYG